MNRIKDMVKDNKKATFQFYRNGVLHYKTECGFEFPVPISDTDNAIFLNEDKALVFMRWIRNHIQFIENAKKDSEIT